MHFCFFTFAPHTIIDYCTAYSARNFGYFLTFSNVKRFQNAVLPTARTMESKELNKLSRKKGIMEKDLGHLFISSSGSHFLNTADLQQFLLNIKNILLSSFFRAFRSKIFCLVFSQKFLTNLKTNFTKFELSTTFRFQVQARFIICCFKIHLNDTLHEK